MKTCPFKLKGYKYENTLKSKLGIYPFDNSTTEPYGYYDIEMPDVNSQLVEYFTCDVTKNDCIGESKCPIMKK